MKRVIVIILVMLLVSFCVVTGYRLFFQNFHFSVDQPKQPTVQQSFVLANNQLVYKGYYYQTVDQTSIKIVAKLIKIEKSDGSIFIVVDVAPDGRMRKNVQILVASNTDEIPLVLIKQKTRDFDANSSDYVTTRPDKAELITELNKNINQFVLLVIPLKRIDVNEPKFAKVKHLVPTYNQYIDCNNSLFAFIQDNLTDTWKLSCTPRIYQAYVVK